MIRAQIGINILFSRMRLWTSAKRVLDETKYAVIRVMT